MANKFATNFAIPATANVFQVVWQLTRVMKAAGWTYKASGNGTTKETAGVAANDLWGGNADPTTDAYPTLDAVAAWWVGSGPQTLKIPLSATPTGVPVRGEIVTQATSGATGELIGFVWDSVGGSGWAVVGPQTGTFDATHTLTGNISSATLTPTGTIVTFNREICFYKPAASTVNGLIMYICADPVAESTLLFSFLATQTGCTASIPPGGGGTSNRFDTSSAVTGIPMCMMIVGTNVAAGQVTGTDAFFGITTGYGSHAQIGCANNTPSAAVTADGSFYVRASQTTSNLAQGCVFTRIDDGDPGDCDPYIFWNGNRTQINTTFNRLVSSMTSAWSFSSTSAFGTTASTSTPFYGYQSRGNTVTSRDIPIAYAGYLPWSGVLGTGVTLPQGGSLGPGDIVQVCSPATSLPIVRYPIGATQTSAASANALRQDKGKCRWLQAIGAGADLGTTDSKTWLQVASWNTAGPPGILVGPYDGTTTPTA